MGLKIDSEKGKIVAPFLFTSFSTKGIQGATEMPEDIAPAGIEKGSLAHLLFITLTTSIDYIRDADDLWQSSRKTFEDPETRYLFDTASLSITPLYKVKKDMQKHGLSRKHNKDAGIWKTVGSSFQNNWGGNPLNFLRACNYDAPTVIKMFNRLKSDFPYLSGPKIRSLWLRMLRDNVGINNLSNLNEIPIPVDIHVVRATFTLGILRGTFEGSVSDAFDWIVDAWFESTKGSNYIPLDIDEPLWNLSKNGCTYRDENGYCEKRLSCEAKKFCVEGRVVVSKGHINIDT